MSKLVGFFGGTFDPIHLGHLNLAIQLYEIHGLDGVLFRPARCSPFKESAQPHVSAEHRLEMVRLALQDLPQFEVTSYEVDRDVPSYTIDTIKGLSKKGTKFRLLLSEESAACFDQWKAFHQLLLLAPPLIGTRAPSSLRKRLADVFHSGFTLTQVFEISSTQIRKRLQEGRYCGHLLPKSVLEYIQKNRLYINK